MTFLKSVHIKSIRNIQNVSAEFDTRHNWFVGENGAGKTSILEAISLLLTSKSFRSRSPRDFVHFGDEFCTISGEIYPGSNVSKSVRLGLAKYKSGKTEIRANSENLGLPDFLDITPPVQVLANDLTNFIDGTGQERRRVLDWGVFHVKHEYLKCWRTYKRVLQQRNSSLRNFSTDHRMILALDDQFVPLAKEVDEYRKNYWNGFIVYLEKNGMPELVELLGYIQNRSVTVNFQFESGWRRGADFKQVLTESNRTAQGIRTTVVGPHRADITVKVNGVSAKEVLSRGQKRLIQAWFKLKQAEFLSEECERHSIFLLDDLSAEIDQDRRSWLYNRLHLSGFQLFSTATEVYPHLLDQFEENVRVFHVKHGHII